MQDTASAKKFVLFVWSHAQKRYTIFCFDGTLLQATANISRVRFGKYDSRWS